MKSEKPAGMPDEVWKQVQNLKYGEGRVRRKAAWALSEIAHGSAIPHLIQALKDENPEVSGNAGIALSEIGEPAIPALKQALKNENETVRQHAAWALKKMEYDKAAVAHLVDVLLKEKDPKVREVAAMALGLLKHESAIEPLIQALKEDDIEVKKAAFQTLLKIGAVLEKKAGEGSKLMPEGEKLLKAITLVKPHFRPNETDKIKTLALHAFYNDKKGEINEKNARLYVKQLRAHEGHLK
ncbi:HEAT repeat domain-containing protein [Candidatus Micrarchaeota archaeon]|nr:HEAT repeat domain-containing protein [Candidatus Micrarchaeota archaeon]